MPANESRLGPRPIVAKGTHAFVDLGKGGASIANARRKIQGLGGSLGGVSHVDTFCGACRAGHGGPMEAESSHHLTSKAQGGQGVGSTDPIADIF